MANLSRSMTAAQLAAAILASALNKGEHIKISDFVTVHNPRNLVGFDSEVITGAPEEITVMATSSNTISTIAYSSAYPDDIIHYDFSDVLCEDGITPRKGKITFRKNTKTNISAYCDYRNCKVLRYSMDAAAWVSGTNYGEGSFAKVGGFIYKKCSVDNPYTEANTVSPDVAQMWIKYLPVGIPLLLGTPSVLYNIGVETGIILTGTTFTPHYLYIFDNGLGVESSDLYKNITDPNSSSGYSNNNYQNTEIKDITLSGGCEGNTIAGSGQFLRNSFTSNTYQNIFIGECQNVSTSGVIKNNIFYKLNNTLLSCLVQGNIILEMASSSTLSEFVFNNVKYAGNCIFGSDIWGNIIRNIGYSYINYHFDRNFVYAVQKMTTLQRVEYCNFGTCNDITVEQELIYTNIPNGVQYITFAAPSEFGEFDLVTNVGSIVGQFFYKKLVSGDGGLGYLQYVNGAGVSVNVAL
ncbi:MAG: hypothetical protein V1775_06880 [Bacteroidota bacterium]